MHSVSTQDSSYPSSPPASAAPPRTSAKILIVVAGIILSTLALATVLVLALNKRAVSDPKVQAQRFFTAARIKDWRALYTLSEAAAKNFSSETEYRSKMQEILKNPLVAIMYEGMLVRPEINVGTPVITGDDATIPITRHEMAAGQPLVTTTNLKMHRRDGVWRVASANGYGSMVAGSFEFSFDSRTATPVGGAAWRRISNGAPRGN